MQLTPIAVVCLVLCCADLCDGQRAYGRLAPRTHARPYGQAAIHTRLPLAMTVPEQQMLADYLGKSSFYFEFGCGGSTALASDIGVLRIVSVDSYMQWVEKVRNVTAARGADVTVNYVDIGEVGFWGFPRGGEKHKWTAYAEFILTVSGTPDLVLIDGRFRVSCFLHSLLVAGKNTTLMIHDFWPRTNAYRAVFSVADVIDGVDSFAAFRRKKDVTDADIRMMIDRYKFDAQ